jgi:hypothetical protein
MKLLSCPLCDSEFLSTPEGPRSNGFYIKYRCREPGCDFRFNVHRDTLRRAGVRIPDPVTGPLPAPKVRMGGSFERDVEYRKIKVTGPGRNT